LRFDHRYSNELGRVALFPKDHELELADCDSGKRSLGRRRYGLGQLFGRERDMIQSVRREGFAPL
jgi:hypothetical protein